MSTIATNDRGPFRSIEYVYNIHNAQNESYFPFLHDSIVRFGAHIAYAYPSTATAANNSSSCLYGSSCRHRSRRSGTCRAATPVRACISRIGIVGRCWCLDEQLGKCHGRRGLVGDAIRSASQKRNRAKSIVLFQKEVIILCRAAFTVRDVQKLATMITTLDK